ncbi:unnamed protein product [Darwinula stevensoni]|uniref:BZIP domain-containing protein n=1 Tax=Darwinula stevensoni TaxID=69355 RepID=A0A7R8XI25_9CRUS|nr:unnamed protein product [Darwinula stevensoni]CAG0893016.1 unnamed protein product [Darwinula stevensoni]
MPRKNVPPKDTDEYLKKRQRNNEAVKKSREKTKKRTEEIATKVEELRQENEKLESDIQILSKELGFLKDILIAHAGSAHGVSLKEEEVPIMMKVLNSGESTDPSDLIPKEDHVKILEAICEASKSQQRSSLGS